MAFIYTECRIPLSLMFVYLPGLRAVRKASGKNEIKSSLGFSEVLSDRETTYELIEDLSDLLIGVADKDDDEIDDGLIDCSIFLDRGSYVVYNSTVFRNRFYFAFAPTLEDVIALQCKEYNIWLEEKVQVLLEDPPKLKRRMNFSTPVIEFDSNGKEVELRRLPIDIFKKLKNAEASIFNQFMEDIARVARST